MKIFDPIDLKNYLKSRNLRPKDYMGQNFLIDEDALNKIVDAADIKKTDTVLEVGPGLGVLTEELVKRAGKVIAVEKDEKLFRTLENEMRNTVNGSATRIVGRLPIRAAQTNNVLTLFNQDILRFHLEKELNGPYKVVANIPYYLTSKLFQYFLEQKNKPEFLVLMVQKEVGERVVANPGKLSILAISVQVHADAEIVALVPKQSFWPTPEVDSVILKIIPKNKNPEIKDEKLYLVPCDNIVEALIKARPSFAETIINALIRAFKESSSFDNAGWISRLLTLYENLNKERVETIFVSTLENSQIIGSRSARPHLKVLFNKYHQLLNSELSEKLFNKMVSIRSV